MSEPKYQLSAPDEYGRCYAAKPLPKDAPNLAFRMVSDSTPVGTHFVVYDAKTGEDVGYLANVSAMSFRMSVDSILCDVELTCCEIPMRLEQGKFTYALGSADPVTVYRLEKAGL